MISINDLTVSFGGTTLLDGISFHINDRDRIGLVGKNGAGKSTILKLIVGLQAPTSGKILKPGGLKIGYLPQLMEHHRGRTVLEETMTVFADHQAMERRLEAISAELAERTDYESDGYNKLIIELNDVNDTLAMLSADPPQQQAERTLAGLGFKRDELGRLTETFSQGWNMRIELAKILLRKPDVLLLDEPTNHLDIESIQWLEDYLQDFPGSLVLISHDRRFLDNCTNRTVEVMLGHIYDYKVPYSQFVALRAERIAQQKAAYANQQRMIEKTEDFIERFRYKPTKSNQVQQRVKQLKKLDRIEIDDEDMATLVVKFPPAPRSGDVAFLVKDAVIGYGHAGHEDEKVILRNVNITIRRGEKVAFVGRNGEGKTTMMRLLMHELEPFAGSAALGHNVNVGYYAQNQDDILKGNDTVYDTLERVAVGEIRTRLRDILAAFLFKGDDIDKKVSVLSGGERSRLAMARLMLHPYNLLALDEPTNHMDIRSKDVLKQALQNYDGTLIVVSHDRDFLNGLVDKVYEFTDGRVKEHLGGVDDFLRAKKADSFRDFEIQASKAASTAMSKDSASGLSRSRNRAGSLDGSPDRTAAAPPGPRATANRKEDKKKKNRQQQLEKQIEELEAKMAEIEKHLSAPTPDDDIMELTRNYLELKRELDEKMNAWAEM